MLSRTVAALAFLVPASTLDARAGSLSETERSALKRLCGGDYATFCGDLPLEGPEVRACFRKNMAGLSPSCREEIGRLDKAGKKG